MAEAQQVEIVLKDPEKRGCSAEIENSTLEKHTDCDGIYIMMISVCLCVCLSQKIITSHFRAERSDSPARPCGVFPTFSPGNS